MAAAAETPTVPLLFVDESPDAASGADNRQDSKCAVYTRESLASTLRLMGTKPRHSVKVAARVFDALEALARTAHASTGSASQSSASPRGLLHRVPRAAARRVLFSQHGAVLPRPQFDALVAWALADFQYTRPDQVDVLQLACRHESTHTTQSSGFFVADHCLLPSQHSRAQARSRPATLWHQRHREIHAGGAVGETLVPLSILVTAYLTPHLV